MPKMEGLNVSKEAGHKFTNYWQGAYRVSDAIQIWASVVAFDVCFKEALSQLHKSVI